MTTRVAITGYSFRLPGTSAESYWQDLLTGRDLITEVPANRWDFDGFLHPQKSHPGTTYTFAAGTIGDVSAFDASFFGISPREAALMDPQQRLLLEMSWEAIENSGIVPSSLRGSDCGVYIGLASLDYSFRMADDLAVVDSAMATGNTASIAANRISYVFDLRGPSMAIDTACSSSLVAFHQACRAILSGETKLALTGGISLHLHPYGFLVFAKASMLSPRGRCRVFDASGDGYVRSEGGGIFLLKDYAQALADGDPILAVIAGSAVNSDGRKSGLTVPSVQAQTALLEKVYAQAGIDPSAIDYFEAHGTGTAVGDPIETRAIGNALGQRRPKNRPLPIGSVKSNMGHLETASGVAGLVKVLHCLRHRTVPATIGLETPNPYIDFDAWNLKPVTRNLALRPSGRLTIGINSFGFGGANAHVIVESPPERGAPPTFASEATDCLPVFVSARTPAALKAAATDFSRFLAEQPADAFYDFAYSAFAHREWHEQRLLIFSSQAATVASALQQFAAGEASSDAAICSGSALSKARGPVFLYSGNGSQWAGMGRRLLAEEPLFRQTIREVDALFNRYADYSIEDELLGRNGDDRYQYTEIAQPTLFALQVGLTRMLRQRRLMPVAVVGHSVGEVAAAWASGALSLADAVAVIYQRSRLQGLTKGAGQMSAVAMGQPACTELLLELGLEKRLVLAGANSSRGVTVAGCPQDLTRLEASLTARQISFKRLDLDYAFHSPAMDAVEAEIRTSLAQLRPGATSIPFVSTVSGRQLPGEQLDAAYWWLNVRQPVAFAAAIDSLLDDGINLFVEIGPHPILRSYVSDCLHDRQIEGRVIPTLRKNEDLPRLVWSAAEQTMIAGGQIDWVRFFPQPGRRLRLPSYPWQRERHWHPVTSETLGLLYRHKMHPLLGYPLPQHALSWENQLDIHALPLLADHVVGDATVFPGAGFAELALIAGRLWHNEAIVEIEELEIRAPLLLNDERSNVIRTHIDAQDGSLTISSRELLSDDPWAVHAVARLLGEAHDGLLSGSLPELPTRAADFTAAEHATLTHAVGIAYGPAFQCIERGWIEDNSVLGKLYIPPVIASQIETMLLHPALLDCAFQLVFQLLRGMAAENEGIAYVPTKLGRIAFRVGLPAPAYAHATLLKQSPRSLQAEFMLFAADGRPVASLRDVRFRSVRLRRGAADRLRFLAYAATPRPHPLAPVKPACLSREQVKAALGEVVRRAMLKGTLRRYAEEVDPLLDSLCARFTRLALEQLSPDGSALPARLIDELRLAHPESAALLTHLLTCAADDESIEAVTEGWRLLPDARNQSSAQDIWNALVADDPDYFQIIHSVGRIGMHLHALLSGTATLAEVCPQETSLSSLLRQVVGSRGREKLGRALRSLIKDGQAALAAGQRIRIVEISQGSPWFAMDICGVLDFDHGDYSFFTSSLDTLENEFGRLQDAYPAIHGQLLAELPPAAGMPTPRCDLAIVTLDFDTIDQALQALDYARQRLAPDASLLVVGQHPSRWIDFVFGARASAWTPDAQGNCLSNQRPSTFWQQHLQSLGLQCAEPFEFAPDTLSGPYLLLAQRPDETPERQMSVPTLHSGVRSWILLADRQGFSQVLADRLAETLRARGDLVIQSSASSAGQLTELLRETTSNYGELDGLVHLAGLTDGAGNETADAAVARQVSRCATAAHILQACTLAEKSTTCWLVTANASNYLLANPGQESVSEAVGLADSALWGFGRTLLNEAAPCTVRLIDLATPLDAADAAAALDREFEQADDEQEVLLTADGARFVLRLRHQTPPSTTQAIAIEEPTVSLGFQFPGQLRNLRWEERPRRSLAAEEIEVEVHATGLNFRDVMFALGLLSDEAIENGFAGPTLGFEFAGVVSRVGDLGCGFSPGDAVVGFGPSSFGNRVVTQAKAIAAIPPEMSFEAAATIPSTFLTVYYSLHHLAKLQPDERVLIHGAAGGVGIAAVQVAKWLGAEIHATAGSNEKRDFLRLLGVDHIYDSRSLAFADQILARTGGEGVDVVLNSLAGEAIKRNFQILRPFGRFLELGKRDFYENSKVGLRPFRNNLSYFGIDADQLMLKQPNLTRRLFGEIMALFHEGVLHPLPYHTFAADDVVAAFRYMQQARQIGKIVITYPHGIHAVHSPARAARRTLQLSADATYLVTGGLRGFGLRTAEWLVSKGARHLLLISRSGADGEEAQSALARFAMQGINVHAAACDVSRRVELATLLAEVQTSMPPLKGVVHAATVIDDALIRNLDAGKIAAVLQPKMLGALHLHELTRQSPLDLFILFSSATTAFGNPGQANYVAANASLEALAAYRRTQGLPATCVGWGPIDDVGFLARNEKIKDALQSRMGGAAIHSAVALEAMEAMLLDDRSGLSVLELDWQALSRFLPSGASSKFGDLAGQAEEGDAEENQSEDIERLLAELPDEELHVAFMQILKNEISEILRLSPDKIDVDRSLYDVGLDSLMGVELVVALEARFGIRLPVMALSQGPTIAKLADRVIRQLRGQDETPSSAGTPMIAEQTQMIAKQHGVDATAEVIAAVTTDLQAEMVSAEKK